MMLYSNTTGSNTTGFDNTANGKRALYSNTTGDYNTCVGSSAYPVSGSVSNYTGIGYLVGTSASASNMVEIGNSSVSVIRGQVGFTTYSDARIKENIQPDVPGLAFISQLKPVTYNLNVRRQTK
ncbi:MAG: tail fiber domain-containing protein [Sphingobacteriales bacterium]|nr:tail fiber domain-containing protein [Sphingobacteriales bacterium]